MRLLLSSVLLTCAWFCVVNIALSGAVWVVSRRLPRDSRPMSSNVLLLIRLAPTIGSSLFAFVLFLPMHWIAEPRGGSESFGFLPWTMAGASMALVVVRGIRMLAAVRACRRLQNSWRSRPGRHPRHHEEVLVVSNLPGVSLAGILRTTIVVGARVKDALTDDELDVAVAHEAAHRCAWDNLKRFAILAAPDVFGLTAESRRLEARWRTEAECEADARAVGGDPGRAANLASALIKVARVVSAPPAGPIQPLWSTFHEPVLLEVRVRRLVADPGSAGHTRVRMLSGLAFAALSLSFVWLNQGARGVHALTEVLVRLLP